MSQIAEQIVEDAMQRIEENESQHAADPVRNFSLTLTDPAEIRVGAEIYFLFEQRLKGFDPDATGRGARPCCRRLQHHRPGRAPPLGLSARPAPRVRCGPA